MNEVFVIERMLCVGIWELLGTIFYTDEKKALDECLNVMKYQHTHGNESFAARVTKLQLVNK